MLAPSKATPSGSFPTGNSVGTVFALYHFSSATFSGFDNGGAPFPAGCAGSAACRAWLGNKFAIARTTTIRDTPITIRAFMTFYSCGQSRNKRLGRNVVYKWRIGTSTSVVGRSERQLVWQRQYRLAPERAKRYIQAIAVAANERDTC